MAANTQEWNRLIRSGLGLFHFHHRSNFGELFEIQHKQVRDGEISAFGRAGASEKDVRNTLADFKPAVTGKSVIERDPAITESLRRAGTFEIFIERGLRQHVGTCPADTVHFKGW